MREATRILSPTVKLDDQGRVLFIHSAALVRNGAVEGLSFYAAGKKADEAPKAEKSNAAEEALKAAVAQKRKEHPAWSFSNAWDAVRREQPELLERLRESSGHGGKGVVLSAAEISAESELRAKAEANLKRAVSWMQRRNRMNFSDAWERLRADWPELFCFSVDVAVYEESEKAAQSTGLARARIRDRDRFLAGVLLADRLMDWLMDHEDDDPEPTLQEAIDAVYKESPEMFQATLKRGVGRFRFGNGELEVDFTNMKGGRK